MKRFFKVADFCFSVSGASDTLWGLAGNYAPFAVRNPDTDILFSLEIGGNLPEGDKLPYHKDNPDEPGAAVVDIYEQAGGLLVELKPFSTSTQTYHMWISSDFRTAVLKEWDVQEGGRFPLDNAAMILFAMASATRNTLAMHASVTVCEGLGFLFLGKSGTGKSTHSRLWLENIGGCSLLNDDNPVVRFKDDRLYVYGTPWSGKTPCYKNESAPVGAFVQLAQAPENHIRKMSVLESLSSLYTSSSGLRKNQEVFDGLDNTCAGILEAVPFWHLDCLPDAAAAHLCHDSILQKKP